MLQSKCKSPVQPSASCTVSTVRRMASGRAPPHLYAVDTAARHTPTTSLNFRNMSRALLWRPCWRDTECTGVTEGKKGCKAPQRGLPTARTRHEADQAQVHV